MTKDREHTNNDNHQLESLGWNPYFQNQLDNPDAYPARVVGVRKNSFLVSDGKTEFLATLAGRLMHRTDSLYPVTGDWVLLTHTMISAVLERKNALSRGAAGARHKQDAQPKKEQMMAANLDTVFIVCGLDRDYNLRRIERYLNLIYNCGLNPAIILTKADLHQDPDPFVDEVEAIAFGVPIHLVSALDNQGLASLEDYLAPGRTSTMVGSSGAGKSTLINRLYGADLQATRSISDKRRQGQAHHHHPGSDHDAPGRHGDRQPRHSRDRLLERGRGGRGRFSRDRGACPRVPFRGLQPHQRTRLPGAAGGRRGGDNACQAGKLSQDEARTGLSGQPRAQERRPGGKGTLERRGAEDQINK
jgi:ribosome small subunit-dependent GTPase A